MNKINTQNRKNTSKGKIEKKLKTMIIVGFLFLFLIFEIGNSSYLGEKKSDSFEDINDDINSDLPLPSDIIADEYTGVGQSLDLLHNANRTDSDVELSFVNGSQASHQIPLGEGWEGYNLQTDLTNLRDNRNWVNGTFDFGDDDGTNETTENDTLDIQNPYQNWTFSENDPGNNNDMSGNYNDSSSLIGKNALELLMHGTSDAGGWHYDQNDYCEWSTDFLVERGQFQDAILKFQANPYHLMDFGSWEIQTYIDGILINTLSSFSLKSMGSGWQDINRPMGVWINTSNVFTSLLNSSSHNLAMQFRYVPSSARYTGFDNGDYQQIFIANVELEIKSDVKAEQLGLKMNNQAISSSDFGVGSITQVDSWTTTPVYANFTANDNPDYNYTIEFSSDLNLFAQKTSPTTNYETNFGSSGTKFNVINDTDSSWEFYSYFSVPTGYVEENFTLYIPSDWTMTWVSTPQLPTDNNITECDISNPGKLIVPVMDLSATPDGFWKFKAESPNYVQNLLTLKNTTETPGPTDWSANSVYFSGDYLNITAQVKTSGVNFTELSSTHANLDIYFPNGTKWFSKSEEVAVSAGGTIQFSSIQIPESGPDYVVGDYDVFISWNNTDGINPINETGMAYIQITIKHYSILVPDDNFIEHFIEGSTTPLRINFFDIVSGDAIESATLTFMNLTGGMQSLNEIAPGYYFTELTAPSINPGNNLLNIEASHPLYASASVDITAEVELKTVLDIDEFPRITVALNKSFVINLNYKEETSGNGITGCNIDVTWEDNFIVDEIGNGDYQIHCNNTNTDVNQIYSIEITVDKYGFQQKTVLNEIKIRQIQTNITTINQNNSFNILPGKNFEPAIFIEDLDFGGYVEGCEVTYTWKYGEADMEETAPGEYSTKLRNIQEGIYTIDIFVYKEGGNYNFQKFQITLNVIAPQEGGIPAFVLYIMGILMVGLIGIFIAYQQYFKYPKTIREIRSLRKNLKKGKEVELSVKTDQDLFVENYLSEIKGVLPSKNQSMLKNKYVRSPIIPKHIAKSDLKEAEKKSKVVEKKEKIIKKPPEPKPKVKVEEKPSLVDNLDVAGSIKEIEKEKLETKKVSKISPSSFIDRSGKEIESKGKDIETKPKKIRYLRKPKIKELPKKTPKKPKKD